MAWSVQSTSWAAQMRVLLIKSTMSRMGEGLDVVDALLGQARPVVQIDAFEVGERGRLAQGHPSEGALVVRDPLPEPHERALRHEPDEEEEDLGSGAVVDDADDEAERVRGEDAHHDGV